MADEPAAGQTPPADELPPQAADTDAADADAADADAADDSDDDIKSKRVTLADLSAKGTALYAHKNYDAAAEVFSRASVLQADINGETAPENAEILFHYGRSLFKVGQSKSDVLGGPPAADNAPAAAKASASPPSQPEASGNVIRHAVAAQAAADKKSPAQRPRQGGDDQAGESAADAKKPLFQFTGDENFDDSDGDDGEAAEEEEQEGQDDDLATAFEILDLARVCYLKQLEQQGQEEQPGKGKDVVEADSPAVRHIKERLADTHDCLAEISLENERYPRAIDDGRVSLTYKMELYPEESEIVAEAHYKLSLALEFASVTVSRDDGTNAKREAMDQALRDEAVAEMELAIKSFRLKMQAKEVDLASMASPEDNDLARKAIAEMKDVVADMEQRLVDLRKDPIDASDLLGGPDAAAPLRGILGAAAGESPADTQARVDDAVRHATDLSRLVRRKPAKDEPANGKRKADDAAGDEPKKAKLADEP